MTLQEMSQIARTVGVPVYVGYAATGANAPYVVIRPMSLDSLSSSVGGESVVWDDRYAFYAVSNSVEASHALSIALMQAVEGARISGSYVSTSIGYVGSLVEGLYETQITALLMKGSLQ